MLKLQHDDYEFWKNDIYRYLCPQCGSHLTIAWGGAFGYMGYIIRCPSDIEHKGMTTHDMKRETELRRGISMDSTALTKMDKQEMIVRIETAKFPQDLTKKDKELLAVAAITYGFDPVMKEISIFQGQPYISCDGRYRKAQETGQLDGVETRPANRQERSDWDIPDGDFFFRSEVYVKGASRPFVGWGRVRQEETAIKKQGDAYKPIVTNPQRMAEKRAEVQALRKAFHIPLPSIEFIGENENGNTTITDYQAPDNLRQMVDDAVEDTIPEPKPVEAEVVEDNDVTINKEQIADLKVAMESKGVRTTWLGEFITKKGWNIRDYKLLTNKQLGEIYAELELIN